MGIGRSIRRGWKVLAVVGATVAAAVVGVAPNPATALSANNSIVSNSVTALAPTACSGHTKIDTCINMRGTVDITAGVGTPSLYSIDELGFIREPTPIGGITPRSFSVAGTPSLGSSPINTTTFACYVFDADPGAAGVLPFSCEMPNLLCNGLYSYHFAASHTTTGIAEHSDLNTTASTGAAYTTPCKPQIGVQAENSATSVRITTSVVKGALAQTMTLEYGDTTTYDTLATSPSGSPVAAANGGTGSVAWNITGLTCGSTYQARIVSSTNDGAINGATTNASDNFTFSTSDCTSPPTLQPITNIDISADGGTCSAMVAAPLVAISGVPTPTVTFNPDMPGTFPVGTTHVTATADNGVDPDATRTFSVHVTDDEDPKVAARPTLVRQAANSTGMTVTWPTNPARDNCPGVTVTASPPSGSLFPVGDTLVTETARDTAGNEASLTFTVRVEFKPIYFIVGQTPTLTAPDAAVRARLTATGRTVINVDDDNLATTNVSGGALIVLSSSVVTTKVGTQLADLAVPMITWEAYLHDDNKLATTPNSGETTTNSTTIQITAPGHPLAAGYTGRPTVMTSGSKLSYATVPATANTVATVPGLTNRAVIFAYARNALRADGTPSPSCRIGFFPDYLGAGKLNTAGRKLLDAAITTALSCPTDDPV